MFTLQAARSGELTLLVDGKSIHSRFEPSREADRFLESQTFRFNPECFILIGPGLGYLKLSIKRLFPYAKIISFHLDINIYKHAYKTGFNWVYNQDRDAGRFLSMHIPDFLLTETVVLNWPPCAELFPERVLNIEKSIRQFFLERNGSIFTTGSLGKRWIKNACSNLKSKRLLLNLKRINKPVIIAASGPTLIDSLELIGNHRNKICLAALPSSLAALNNSGIRPDFVFHTDPGFWANYHLSCLPDTEIPVIMPLTSSFKSNMNNPMLLFSQGTFFEKELIADLFPSIPPHGTVAGTAYLLLRQFCVMPIIFVGLDFCYNDIQEHVKPHSFNQIIFENQSRLNSNLNLLYTRLKNLEPSNLNKNTTRALLTYSGWFNNKNRLVNAYRYNPSPINTDGLCNIDTDKLLKFLYNKSMDEVEIQFTEPSIFNIDNNRIPNAIRKLIREIEVFKTTIPEFDSKKIISVFSENNFLTEIFQFTAYPVILKLTHSFRKDPAMAKALINDICNTALEFSVNLSKRY